jgi:hypothetical protein
MGPLHPLAFELYQQGRAHDVSMFERWKMYLPNADAIKKAPLMSPFPMLASASLQAQLQERSRDLLEQLQPFLKANNSLNPAWKNAIDADVLSVDYAIVADEKNAWSLRLVEFQSFTSIMSACYLMHQAYKSLWPELEGHYPWQTIASSATSSHQSQEQAWLERCRAWVAGEGTVLLERNPEQYATYFDLLAASNLWQVPMLEPAQLIANLQEKVVNKDALQIRKVLNRLIVNDSVFEHQAALIHPKQQQLSESKHERDHASEKEQAFLTTLRQLDLNWHNHPAWYCAINKGTACQLNLKHEPKNVLATEWRSLGLPAEQLVAKHIHSFGGKDVLLSPSSQELDALEHPETWVVQPRYRSFPIMESADGHPLYAEIRLIIQLKPNGEHWTAMQFARLFHGQAASSGSMLGSHLEGLSLVYNMSEIA